MIDSELRCLWGCLETKQLGTKPLAGSARCAYQW